MITAVVTVGSESNEPGRARRAQGSPGVDSRPQSLEPGRLPGALPLAGARQPANSTPTGRSVAAGSTPRGTILDFVRARNGRSTPQSHEASWSKNHVILTLIDIVLIAGLFLTAVLFYPAMAWIVLLS